MKIKLAHSYARRQFKKKMGQANHFLVTILVGLSEVYKGTVKKPDTMDVSWNPQSVQVSSLRSMRYALNSSLAWAVDNLDAYVQTCMRNPKLIEGNGLSEELDSAGKSVYEKFKVLHKRYSRAADIEQLSGLVALSIQWRNVTTHQEAKNELDDSYLDILKKNKEWYVDNFRHLDVDIALKRFSRHRNPSLKEVTSMIAAISKFVGLIDEQLIKDLNMDRYLKELFDKHFNSEKNKSGQDQRIFLPTLSPKRQYSRVKNVLLSNGFSETPNHDGIDIDEVFMKKYFGNYMR